MFKIIFYLFLYLFLVFNKRNEKEPKIIFKILKKDVEYIFHGPISLAMKMLAELCRTNSWLDYLRGYTTHPYTHIPTQKHTHTQIHIHSQTKPTHIQTDWPFLERSYSIIRPWRIILNVKISILEWNYLFQISCN